MVGLKVTALWFGSAISSGTCFSPVMYTSCLAPHVSQQRRKDLSADENRNGFLMLITKPSKITLQTLVTGIETVNSPHFLTLTT